MLEGI